MVYFANYFLVSWKHSVQPSDCKKRGHVVAQCWKKQREAQPSRDHALKAERSVYLPPGSMVYFANCFLVSRKHSVQPSGHGPWTAVLSVNTVQQTAKKCNYCKKRGHVVAQCWKKQREAQPSLDGCASRCFFQHCATTWPRFLQ
jgi:hypothetical protein